MSVFVGTTFANLAFRLGILACSCQTSPAVVDLDSGSVDSSFIHIFFFFFFKPFSHQGFQQWLTPKQISRISHRAVLFWHFYIPPVKEYVYYNRVFTVRCSHEAFFVLIGYLFRFWVKYYSPLKGRHCCFYLNCATIPVCFPSTGEQ